MLRRRYKPFKIYRSSIEKATESASKLTFMGLLFSDSVFEASRVQSAIRLGFSMASLKAEILSCQKVTCDTSQPDTYFVSLTFQSQMQYRSNRVASIEVKWQTVDFEQPWIVPQWLHFYPRIGMAI
jgi:hypothetical protein